ncbi:histidine phosphatase family protein [Croceibacterium sp. TMG7-5b_MA50]|uniref:histidine phosphatase family protein n=1 Tax=Croceibacterium sp. TMG7-5b_MA50 TaxID=3121290 RepID=UPI003221DAB1
MPSPVPPFVIVRHGNTFVAGEPPRRIGWRTDLPLTDAGIAQGQALGRHFAQQGWNFARVLVSPLARTRQTAAAIALHLPDAPAAEDCAWLREIDHGPDEDQPEAAVLRRVGADALAAWDEAGTAPADWVVDAEERLAGWRRLFTAEAGPTLLVTSNGAARFALLATGLQGGGGLKLATGSYGLLRRDGQGQLAVDGWNLRP